MPSMSTKCEVCIQQCGEHVEDAGLSEKELCCSSNAEEKIQMFDELKAKVAGMEAEMILLRRDGTSENQVKTVALPVEKAKLTQSQRTFKRTHAVEDCFA